MYMWLKGKVWGLRVAHMDNVDELYIISATNDLISDNEFYQIIEVLDLWNIRDIYTNQ